MQQESGKPIAYEVYTKNDVAPLGGTFTEDFYCDEEVVKRESRYVIRESTACVRTSAVTRKDKKWARSF